MNSLKDDIKSLADGREAAVFGTGSSGSAAQKLLNVFGIKTEFYFQNGSKHASSDNGQNFDSIAAKKHKLVVYSPAFRPDHEWLKLARENGASTICEPDLSALAWKGKIVAVTGTNGKTTITSFLASVLNDCGFQSVAAGNIGVPLSEFAANDPNFGSKKVAVCELSSFQTFGLKYLRPDALVWTNFAPDHLDWHKDMAEYFSAKYNLVKALKSDKLYVGSSVSEAAKKYGYKLPDFAKIFDETQNENHFRAPEPFGSAIQTRNFEISRAFLLNFGISEEKILESAQKFSLPLYRFTSPQTVGNVKFYNDSKATNAHAAIAALRELKNEKNLVWLGGGKNKYCDIDELVDEIMKSAKGAVLIGQTAEILRGKLEKLPLGAEVCKTMEIAVKKAKEMVDKNGNGGSVLFSPAFSSFGMFSGYAERGKSFDSSVLCLKNLK